jgi:hypothetical protein
MPAAVAREEFGEVITVDSVAGLNAYTHVDGQAVCSNRQLAEL